MDLGQYKSLLQQVKSIQEKNLSIFFLPSLDTVDRGSLTSYIETLREVLKE